MFQDSGYAQLTELTEVMKKMKILICRILKAVHYRVYKCTAILHTPMGRTHGEHSMSNLDNDAKRVANIYMELLSREKWSGRTTFRCQNWSDPGPLFAAKIGPTPDHFSLPKLVRPRTTFGYQKWSGLPKVVRVYQLAGNRSSPSEVCVGPFL